GLMADKLKSKGGGDVSAAAKDKTADGPRKPKPAGRSAPHEAQSGGSFGGAYSDPSTTGWFDATEAFKTAHGKPSPRQRAMRGEDVGGTHTEPGQEASIGLVNPID